MSRISLVLLLLLFGSMPPAVRAVGLPDGYRTAMHRPMHWETFDQFLTPPGTSAGSGVQIVGTKSLSNSDLSLALAQRQDLEAAAEPDLPLHWLKRLPGNEKMGENKQFIRPCTVPGRIPPPGTGESRGSSRGLDPRLQLAPPRSSAETRQGTGMVPPATGESRGSRGTGFTSRLDPILGRLIQDHKEVEQLKGLLVLVERDQNRLNAESREMKQRMLRLLKSSGAAASSAASQTSSVTRRPKMPQDFESGYKKAHSNAEAHRLGKAMSPTLNFFFGKELSEIAKYNGPDAPLLEMSPKKHGKRRLIPNDQNKFN